MELKKKLSQLRKDRGLPQLELAEAIGVSRQAVSRWEVGTAVPTLDNLVNLSELYQVPLDYLVRDGMEKPEPKEPEPAAPEHKAKPHTSNWRAALALPLLGGALLLHAANHTTERNEIMDIVNAVRASMYQPIQSAVARAEKDSSFTDQLKNDYGISATPGGYTVILSPAVKLRLDYNKWKETQLPQELPDSQGLTEENLTYLRERYVGPLTIFQKMEALDTMFDMGIITREQRNAFYGTIEKTWTSSDLGIRSGPLEDGPSTSFSARQAQLEQILYRLSPLAKSETLDDLFSWLESDDLFSWLESDDLFSWLEQT